MPHRRTGYPIYSVLGISVILAASLPEICATIYLICEMIGGRVHEYCTSLSVTIRSEVAERLKYVVLLMKGASSDKRAYVSRASATPHDYGCTWYTPQELGYERL
jgi:hypothetical protein